MKSFMVLMTVLLTVLTAKVPDSQACSCTRRELYEFACSAHFVILAEVTNVINSLDEVTTTDENSTEPPRQDTVTYELDVKGVFKADEAAAALLQQGVSSNLTLATHSECRPHLVKDTLYLLTGHTSHGKLDINACDLHRPWSLLRADQREGFRTEYYTRC